MLAGGRGDNVPGGGAPPGTGREARRRMDAPRRLAPEAEASVPLVVDLDDTLLRSDLLHESTLALLKRAPLLVFLLPLWLARGRARLKREIARRVDLDTTAMPFNQEFLDHLRAQRADGRTLVLATASDEKYAHQIADELGLFDEVLASDGAVNLCGKEKLAALRSRFPQGFDYAGNGRDDLPLWRAARMATVVGGSDRIERTVTDDCTAERVFSREPASLRDYLRALRIHQWLKNLLVFVPLVTALQFTDLAALAQLAITFVSFSLCASSVYVLNDLVDLEDDRQHPRKCQRPFACGSLSIARGCVLVGGLLIASIGVALLLPLAFLGALLGYYAITLAYSFGLKHAEILDILTLAMLYTMRIVAGGAAASIALSFWLLAFSLFLFLSLALAKRCAELAVMRERGQTVAPGRGYRVTDLPLLHSLGAGAGYIAILVLALYLTSDTVQRSYTSPALLWALCPLLLYWITRTWLKTFRGEMHDDPVVFAARDGSSRVVAVLGVATIWFAM